MNPLLAFLRVPVLHLNRRLRPFGIVPGGIVGTIETAMQKQQAAQTEAGIEFFHHESP